MISNIEKKKILVIGDCMLDVYYDGKVNRISPEAPVPVFLKQSERYVLGGAGNVAVNLVAAGQAVSLMSVIGTDQQGQQVKTLLKQLGVDESLLFETKIRPTVTKIRYLADNHQQVMRTDIEDASEISEDEAKCYLERLESVIADFDMVVFSDYAKGMLTPFFLTEANKLIKRAGLMLVTDVKGRNLSKYQGIYLLKPNQKELGELSGISVETDEQIKTAAKKIREAANISYVLVTLGARGMTLFGDSIEYHVASTGKEVFDVTGAGDTTIAYLTAALANGFSLYEAVDLANQAAGIEVGKVGTASVTLEEIEKKRVEKHNTEKVVFTNGCFDILHIGHVRYLQKARTLGDKLIVGLNTDNSVKRLKGEGRPINTMQDRKALLEALECVDEVIPFDEDTPYELIQNIQPDILVKGGDYQEKDVIGRDIVESRGGHVEIIDFVEGKSTTDVIERIKSRC